MYQHEEDIEKYILIRHIPVNVNIPLFILFNIYLFFTRLIYLSENPVVNKFIYK